MIHIDEIRLYLLRLPLVRFFETSFGRTTERQILLVEVVQDGISGWGEVTAGEHPFFNEEWTHSIWEIVKEYVAPRLLGKKLERAAAVGALSKGIRGHNMARGGVETAVWDLEARLLGQPLWQRIGGGARPEIPCGVSIGIQDTVDDLLHTIDAELRAGYRRIKLKIKPGWDIDVLRAVRQRFPDIQLTVDANSAYTLKDTEHLKQVDEFGLVYMEQPLSHDDIIDHATLQQQLRTAICLDECIRAPRHAEQAIALGACRVINIKLGRVGGFASAIAIHNAAQAAGIPVWCGGMLEAGIGRAHNIALASLPNFVLPGDVSASKRYWTRDIIQPEVTVNADGMIALPEGAGFGFALDLPWIQQLSYRRETLRA
ncbi:MAG: o-succinylbenzoate synthase [Bryobacterales bacterium]|jgi:O-succinylbenzoate synthase|nr:o-succinylbenzoate synthase [Bryobacterales bacterium]